MLSLLLQNPAPKDAPCKTTLIVCPLSMLDQWLDEIRSRVKGSQVQVCHVAYRFTIVAYVTCVKVNVYYGNNRIKDANWLKKCDVGMHLLCSDARKSPNLPFLL